MLHSSIAINWVEINVLHFGWVRLSIVYSAVIRNDLFWPPFAKEIMWIVWKNILWMVKVIEIVSIMVLHLSSSHFVQSNAWSSHYCTSFLRREPAAKFISRSQPENLVHHQRSVSAPVCLNAVASHVQAEQCYFNYLSFYSPPGQFLAWHVKINAFATN